MQCWLFLYLPKSIWPERQALLAAKCSLLSDSTLSLSGASLELPLLCHARAGHMQRLMAELTEAVHLSQGHTRLYLPTESLDNPTVAVTDKASYSLLAL